MGARCCADWRRDFARKPHLSSRLNHSFTSLQRTLNRTDMFTKYNSFDDFSRDHIRPGLRAGWSLDDLQEPMAEDNDFDLDPFEAALRAAEYEEDEEQDERE